MTSKAFELARLGNAYSDGALSNRNAIINGSFKVSQRGDYTSATAVSTNYGYLVDRWAAYGNFGSEFTHVNNSAKLEATTSATNRMFLRNIIEAQDVLSSTPHTLSFFVTTNSSSFGVHINDSSATIDTSVISVSSGVRTKITVTFDTPSSLNTKLEIAIGVFASGRTNTSITTGEYFTLEEVQLEVGDTATPFEHRTYGDELLRCQRYFAKTYDTDNYAGDLDYDGSFSQRSIGSTASNIISEPFPVRMRAIPTVTFYGTTAATNAAGKIRGSGDGVISASTLSTLSERVMSVTFTSNQTNSFISGHYYADAEL